MKRLIYGFPFLFTAANLLAQASPDAADAAPLVSATPDVLSDKAAAGIVAGACGLMLIPILISLAIWLWIAIWIMKDSARRQSPNRTLVVVLGWLVPVVGLIVHLATRPKTIPGAPNP